MTLREISRQIVPQAVVDRQLLRHSPRVSKVETSVGLFLRHQRRDLRFTEIVVEPPAHLLAVSQQEIGEVTTGVRHWIDHVVSRPAAIELESAAGDIRLGVVVVGLDELAAKHPGVTSLDPSKAW